MKKVFAILAATVAAIGSTLPTVPVNASTANLPVEVKVEPYIYLRTYKELKFVVSQQNLGGQTVDQTMGDQAATPNVYDESKTSNSLNTVPPNPTTVSGTQSTVTKTINPLYLIWGASGSTASVKVEVIKGTLTGPLTKTATMTVEGEGTAQNSIALDPANAKSGKVDFKFNFTGGPTTGTYTGGEVAITVATP